MGVGQQLLLTTAQPPRRTQLLQSLLFWLACWDPRGTSVGTVSGMSFLGSQKATEANLKPLQKNSDCLTVGVFHSRRVNECQPSSFRNTNPGIYFANCVSVCEDWNLYLTQAAKFSSIHPIYRMPFQFTLVNTEMKSEREESHIFGVHAMCLF